MKIIKEAGPVVAVTCPGRSVPELIQVRYVTPLATDRVIVSRPNTAAGAMKAFHDVREIQAALALIEVALLGHFSGLREGT